MPSPANALVTYTRASTLLARVITPVETVDDEHDVVEQVQDKAAFSAGLATVRIADAMLAELIKLKRT